MNYIVVTGAAGFIGSCLIQRLHNEGYENIVAVDDFSKVEKLKNLENKSFIYKVKRTEFFSWLDVNYQQVDFILHIGARTDTTETNWDLFQELNVNYSQRMWENCAFYGIPLIYASSAATYGLGEQGYFDNHSVVEKLKPLNLYGISKNEIDKWVLKQETAPPFWAGLKFFNVYGPNEYHKKRMASVVFHAFEQIKTTGTVKLFRSHNENFKDGEQLRDFVYVKDVVNVISFLMKYRPDSGLYNLGSGKARSFNDLVSAVFNTLHKEKTINFIDTPEDIRDKYQYFTEAKMDKLIDAGYNIPLTSLEEGVSDYINNYLMPSLYF
ncbi:MAG: ADP-glyceromanno-heptose 6-epimerase [Bacteroidales bacterium]|jgi:ADP-L-glycero-D-manno-heptose 6-epimerase|nr:ADP-glyceromanno-heptose 6-epimerase [Bacteroidales bacterium]OQA91809.1 MAG: ADP-L-glycero-D-manno-heptose-6-epimerase [Bacteroidetes bacterium ADurb.Bin234]